MRRPAVRFLLILATAVSMLGLAPATSEAGIIPWAWDTLFGPVGSIQARRAGYNGCNDCGYTANYGAGCCYGPAPRFAGFRGWRNNACCGTAGYGYASGYGCSSCGTSCGTGCATGCSSCGTGYDGGFMYGSVGGCGPGGCANGQCGVNYGPDFIPPTTGGAAGGSPVTPAPVPAPAGGPGPGPSAYDNSANPGTSPMPGVTSTDEFVPAGKAKQPAPPTGDPTKEEYVPPIDNNKGAVDANGNTTTVPPVTPNPAVPKKKPSLTDPDDKDTSVGPRLELDQKVTWRQSFERTRQNQAPVRVTASARRNGVFPKIAWRTGVETELAKK